MDWGIISEVEDEPGKENLRFLKSLMLDGIDFDLSSIDVIQIFGMLSIES